VLDLILYVIAIVCFALVTFNIPARINLLGLGLLAWVLVPAIAVIQSHTH
jgi:hypothetical protein